MKTKQEKLFTANILESAIDYAIEFLPALPDAWHDGNFKGVCARGGFEIDMTWKENKTIGVQLKSKAGSVCRIMNLKGKATVTSKGKKIKVKQAGDVIEFQTEKGEVYLIEMKP